MCSCWVRLTNVIVGCLLTPGSIFARAWCLCRERPRELAATAATSVPSAPEFKGFSMAVYTVKIRSGDVLTIEDERDLVSLSRTLRDDGFLEVASNVSAYGGGKQEWVSLMVRAVEYIKIKEMKRAGDRPGRVGAAEVKAPAGVRAMINQITEAVSGPSAFIRPRKP